MNLGNPMDLTRDDLISPRPFIAATSLLSRHDCLTARIGSARVVRYVPATVWGRTTPETHGVFVFAEDADAFPLGREVVAIAGSTVSRVLVTGIHAHSGDRESSRAVFVELLLVDQPAPPAP